MHFAAKVLLGAAVLGSAMALAHAQGVGTMEIGKASVTDPSGPMPDPSHIPFTPPDNIKWEGNPAAEQHFTLFGDPSKPGMYAQLLKWNPGSGTKPHIHDQDRYVYVISGTWWVAPARITTPSSAIRCRPAPFSRMSPTWCIGMACAPARNRQSWNLVGMGPVKTILVDEDGKPVPPLPRPAP